MATSGIKGLTITGDRLQVRGKGFKTKTFAKSKMAEALRYLYTMQLQNLNGDSDIQKTKALPLVVVARAYVSTEIARRKSPATVKSYESVVKRLEADIAQTPVEAVTMRQLQDHLDNLSRKYTHGLVTKTRAALNIIFKYLERDGLVEKNGVSTLATTLNATTVSAEHARAEIMKMDDYKAVLHGLSHGEFDSFDQLTVLIVSFMGHLMARDSEALSIKWSDIDWDAKTINVHASLDAVTGDLRPTKNGLTAKLPASDALLSQLRTWRDTQKQLIDQTDDSFIISDGGRTSVKLPRLNYHWKKMQRHLGVTDPKSLYVLRRTGASWLASPEPYGAGINAVVSSIMLRHTLKLDGVSDTTTRHYLTSSSEELKEVFAKVRMLQDSY